MIDGMKHRLIGLFAVACSLLMPVMALAQDEKPIYDARLEGYNTSVTLDGGGSGLTWLLLIVMGALCLGVLFKSSGRTHLD